MLEIKNLTKKFNDLTLFSKLNYQFKENNIYGLIGKTGTGKTTLLKMIANLDLNYHGNIYFNNVKITDTNGFFIKNVAFIYQDFKLIEKLSVKENCFLSNILNHKNNEKEFYALLKLFKLQDKIDTPCNLLSGGEKQRVCIIRELLKKPKILLCDEPTSNLDKNLTKTFYEYIKNHNKDMITIIVSHNLDDIYNYCDEIIDLNNYQTNSKQLSDNSYTLKQTLSSKQCYQLNKKAMATNKRLKKFCLWLMVIGLVGLGFGFLIRDFVDFIAATELKNYQTPNSYYISSNNKETSSNKININFDKEYYFYDTLTSETKNYLKKNITDLKINDVEIDIIDFVFENKFIKDVNFLISLPINYQNKIPYEFENVIELKLLDKTYKLNTYNLEYNYQNQYVLYSNNIDFLKPLLIDLKLPTETNQYIYSRYAKEIHASLLNDKRYLNYQFILQDSLIYYKNINKARISYQDFLTFYIANKNQIEDYFLANNEDLYVDESGMMFLFNIKEIKSLKNNYKLEKSDYIRLQYYENKLDDNEIVISSAIANLINIKKTHYITLIENDKEYTYQVKNIIKSEDNSLIIYANSRFLRQFYQNETTNIYSGIVIAKSYKSNFKNNKNINCLKIQSFSQMIVSIKTLYQNIFNYSFIIVGIAIICVIQLLHTNYIKKKKNREVLYYQGINKTNIFKISFLEFGILFIKSLILSIFLLLFLYFYLNHFYLFKLEYSSNIFIYLLILVVLTILCLLTWLVFQCFHKQDSEIL